MKRYSAIPIGTWEVFREGTGCGNLNIWNDDSDGIEAAEILAEKGITCKVVNARFIKPLDTAMLDDLFARECQL